MRVTRLMRVATAALLAFSLIPATAMAGETTNEANVTVTNTSFTQKDKYRISGHLDLAYQKPSTDTHTTTKNADGTWTYSDTIVGRISVKELFKGAYQEYKAHFESCKIMGRECKNLVMFSEGKEFPSMRYTMTFPENFTITNPTASSTSSLASLAKISEVTTDTAKHTKSVTFTFNLGQWNDYEGFFKLYDEEKNNNAAIEIKVPFTAPVENQNAKPQGTITGTGLCELYYYGKNFFINLKLGKDKRIVNITATMTITL